MAVKRLQGEKEKREGIYYEFDTASQLLGEGGTGKVFRGRRVNEKTGEAHDVAIKFMYSDLPENVIERARRESAIQLKNDNLVEMMGFFEMEDTLPNGTVMHRYHVVSELLSGVMLSDLMHGKTTDPDGNEIPYAQKMYKDYINDPYRFSIYVVKNVLAGLMALHEAGYIHRDIDPTNIMITSDEHIKLIDFGIAKQMMTLNTYDKSLTATGQFVGKASYAAPELVLGDIKNQNKSTDLYSVGILLFQCLVGHLPFEGTDSEILAMQLHKKIPVGLIRQSAIRKVLEKATDKRQEKRYQSAAEFIVALDQIVKLPYPETFSPAKRMTIIGVAAVAGALLFLGLNMFFNKSDAPKTVEVEEAAPDAFVTMLDNLKDETTAKEGLRVLDSLVNADNAEATWLKSRLLFVSESSSDYRPDSIKLMQKTTGLKPDAKQAHELLLKTVELKSDDYRALYELGCDFIGGAIRTTAVARDRDKALEYFKEALKYAEQAKDEDYVKLSKEKIETYQ
jgi:serine/threonine-protein kinase